jgi:uncharacterized protein
VHWLEFGMAFLTAAVGSIGGLGGAVLLVPLLVLAGMSARTAAPLGLVSVAAGSLAASPRQLGERLVNHRLGLSTELVASAAAVAGALASGLVGDRVLKLVLAAVALGAGVFAGRRKGVRNHPQAGLTHAAVGEHVGALSGVYRLRDDAYVPYRAVRVGEGAAFFALAGALAGMAGASGGFIKTPAMSEVMHVPVRVAAATTTFTVGVTSAIGLVVFWLQGRLDFELAGAVCAGSMLGGIVGSRLQSALAPQQVRRFLSVVLVCVSGVMFANALR